MSYNVYHCVEYITTNNQSRASVNCWTFIYMTQLFAAKNKLAEAEALYRRALATNETVLGPEHPEVANVLSNLAVLLMHQVNL